MHIYSAIMSVGLEHTYDDGDDDVRPLHLTIPLSQCTQIAEEEGEGILGPGLYVYCL